jgi:hypothetical protein
MRKEGGQREHEKKLTRTKLVHASGMLQRMLASHGSESIVEIPPSSSFFLLNQKSGQKWGEKTWFLIF